MKKILATCLMICLITLGAGAKNAHAGEIDILLQKLVEKGLLTAGEAQKIGTETKEQVKAELAAGKSSSIPAWLQATKIKGDFRLRYQWDHTANVRNDQNRGRVRLRIGLDSKVNEKLAVSAGLATGLADDETITKDTARSTNQTLGNGFSKHPITLDYAYAKYSPTGWATMTGGKFKNVLWEPGDLIWDTDINPEGGAVQLSKNINAKTNLFLNTTALILDEVNSSTASSSSSDDPMLYVAQGGATINATNTITLKGAVSYYASSNVKGNKLDGTTSTNSKDGSDKLLYEYGVFAPAMEVSIKEPFKWINIAALNIQQLSVFGEYVANQHLSKDATGAMAGLKLGMEKIATWGDWQFGYNYAYLLKNAILDILPDSDRVGGKTGIRAHEATFQYGLGKNTFLSLDYYQGWTIASNPTPQHLVQVDWNLKF